MNDVNNLVVVLRRRGESRPEICVVSRMTIDKHGNLLLWRTPAGDAETIPAGDFELLSIHTPQAITKAA